MRKDLQAHKMFLWLEVVLRGTMSHRSHRALHDMSRGPADRHEVQPRLERMRWSPAHQKNAFNNAPCSAAQRCKPSMAMWDDLHRDASPRSPLDSWISLRGFWAQGSNSMLLCLQKYECVNISMLERSSSCLSCLLARRHAQHHTCTRAGMFLVSSISIGACSSSCMYTCGHALRRTAGKAAHEAHPKDSSRGLFIYKSASRVSTQGWVPSLLSARTCASS